MASRRRKNQNRLTCVGLGSVATPGGLCVIVPNVVVLGLIAARLLVASDSKGIEKLASKGTSLAASGFMCLSTPRGSSPKRRFILTVWPMYLLSLLMFLIHYT